MCPRSFIGLVWFVLAVLPFWSSASLLASSDLRRPLLPLNERSRWVTEGERLRPSSANKLAASSDVTIWQRISSDLEMSSLLLCFPCCHGGGWEAVDGKEPNLRQAEPAISSLSLFSEAIESWRLLDPGGRLPASPLTILVEGQPLSSQPMCNKGGSTKTTRWLLLPALALGWRWNCGELVAPSGHVPGGGEYPLLKLRVGTDLQSSFLIWGPLCKVYGLECIFYVCLGPCMSCTVSLINSGSFWTR